MRAPDRDRTLDGSSPAGRGPSAGARSGRFLDAAGATLHCVDAGRGPPVVLVHGIGSTLEDWFISGVAGDLLRDHRVVAVDRPGYGHSTRPSRLTWTPERQADAIAGLMDGLGIAGAVVAAHSFGVLPAIALALRHPSTVRALVLLAGFYYPGATVARTARAVAALPGLGPLARTTLAPPLARAAMPALVRAMFAPDRPTAAFQAGFPVHLATRSTQLEAGADDTARIEPATRRLSPHYHRLALPVTAVAGEADTIVDAAAQTGRLARTVPGAQALIVPATGHMVHHTATDRVTAAIREALDGAVRFAERGAPGNADGGQRDAAGPA